MRFSTLLVGGEAMKPKEFATRKPGLIVGTSVSIIARGSWIGTGICRTGPKTRPGVTPTPAKFWLMGILSAA